MNPKVILDIIKQNEGKDHFEIKSLLSSDEIDSFYLTYPQYFNKYQITPNEYFDETRFKKDDFASEMDFDLSIAPRFKNIDEAYIYIKEKREKEVFSELAVFVEDGSFDIDKYFSPLMYADELNILSLYEQNGLTSYIDISKSYVIINKYESSKVASIYVFNEYIGDFDKVNEYYLKSKEKAKEIAKNLFIIDMPDYMKILLAYNYVGTTALYDKDAYNKDDILTLAHTAYGALIQNKTVCDGYSKAIKLILEEAGIKTLVAFGEHKYKYEPKGHSWILSKIDGNWYFSDLTWSIMRNVEIDNKIYPVVIDHFFFLRGDEMMNYDRKYNEICAKLYPKCNSTKDFIPLIKDFINNHYNELLNIKYMKEEQNPKLTYLSDVYLENEYKHYKKYYRNK